jgi:hypothetical protein
MNHPLAANDAFLINDYNFVEFLYSVMERYVDEDIGCDKLNLDRSEIGDPGTVAIIKFLQSFPNTLKVNLSIVLVVIERKLSVE